jgi:hypothetical protein
MTKFADQLFDDLMQEHGATLAGTRVPTPKRRLATRPVLLTAGAGSLAVAATVTTLTIGGGTPAYAVTTHPDGSVALVVYQQSGIAGINAKLRELGDRVVVVPVRSDCPSINSLRPPAVPAQISVKPIEFHITANGITSSADSAIVATRDVPARDILVLAFRFHSSGNSRIPVAAYLASKLTSGPTPSCVSVPSSLGT